MFWARGLVQLSAVSVSKLNLQAELAPGNWNQPEDAFGRFFRVNSAVPFSGFFDEDDDDVDFVCVPGTFFVYVSLKTPVSLLLLFVVHQHLA